MTRHAPLRHLTLIVPMALLMAACGSDDPSASNAAGSSTTEVESAAGPAEVATSGGTDDSADTTSTTPPTTSSTTPPTTSSTTTTTEVAPDPESCLPGTWELRVQDFFDQMADLAAAQGGGIGTMRHLGGRHLTIFHADGTFESPREAWTFEGAAPEGSLILTVDANATGTWAADGDILRVTSEEQRSEVSVEMEIGGVRQPFPFPIPNTVDPDAGAFGGEDPYICDGDVLTITFTDAGLTITNTWDRVAG